MKTDQDTMKGRAKGGAVVASKMSVEERAARARMGGLARWGKPIQAIRKGNFQKEFGLDVECYVLGDVGKTAVISQSGMARALGISPRGNVFERFTSSQALADFVGAEMQQKLQNPLIFQWGSGGAEQPPSSVKGFDAALLIDLCNAIAAASAAGRFGRRYEKIVQQAAIITGASAKSGIKHLVYALAGYNPSAEEVITAFKVYVREEAKKYEQEFPNELYMAWHRLYKIPIPVRGKPWQFMHLTRRHIYFPLAKSNGKVYELLKALKAKGGDQNKKLFQFLNDIGARALRMQLGRVLEMAESSGEDAAAYEEKITFRFGGQQELDLVLPPPNLPTAT